MKVQTSSWPSRSKRRVDPKLHRVLAEQIAWASSKKPESFDHDNYVLFRTYLENHRDERCIDDLELASFICVSSIEALTHNAVLHYSKMLSHENDGAHVW